MPLVPGAVPVPSFWAPQGMDPGSWARRWHRGLLGHGEGAEPQGCCGRSGAGPEGDLSSSHHRPARSCLPGRLPLGPRPVLITKLKGARIASCFCSASVPFPQQPGVVVILLNRGAFSTRCYLPHMYLSAIIATSRTLLTGSAGTDFLSRWLSPAVQLPLPMQPPHLPSAAPLLAGALCWRSSR